MSNPLPPPWVESDLLRENSGLRIWLPQITTPRPTPSPYTNWKFSWGTLTLHRFLLYTGRLPSLSK